MPARTMVCSCHSAGPIEKNNALNAAGVSEQAQLTIRPGTPVQGNCVSWPAGDINYYGSQAANPYAPVLCKVCSGPVQICEQITRIQTCEWPNNTCATRIEKPSRWYQKGWPFLCNPGMD